jgi:6-phosphogluconolactonase
VVLPRLRVCVLASRDDAGARTGQPLPDTVLEVVADEKAAAQRGAELIAAAGAAAVAERNIFALAMSGGRTPWAMLAMLSENEEMPWAKTELFQADERIAAPGSEERNLTHMVLGLSLDHQSALRPMPVTQRDLEAAAREYASSLPERLDLVHLGLGADGHTASLIPGDPVLEAADRRIAVTENAYEGHRRMTLTYPALAAAGQILWLVTGEAKREALARLLDGDRTIPAGRVENERMVVVADEAAAADLNR